jgi:putative methionine-R-sulfoxide reductase with GAF domain
VYEVTESEVAILGYAGPGAPAFPATGQAVVVDDVTSDPRYLTAFGSTRSEMIVPVAGSDGTSVVGTIDVESDRFAAFGTEERQLVERLAHAILPLYATH